MLYRRKKRKPNGRTLVGKAWRRAHTFQQAVRPLPNFFGQANALSGLPPFGALRGFANQDIWLEKAATLPQRGLDREIAKAKPETIQIFERIRPIGDDRSELKLGIARRLEEKLARVKDLLAQKLKRHVTMEEALDALADGFVEKNDLVLKARRSSLLASEKPVAALKNGKRSYQPAAIRHAVAARDEGQCTFVLPNGRCDQRRWVHRHHVNHVAHGGTHAGKPGYALFAASPSNPYAGGGKSVSSLFVSANKPPNPGTIPVTQLEETLEPALSLEMTRQGSCSAFQASQSGGGLEKGGTLPT
jgi:hypothetical protein